MGGGEGESGDGEGCVCVCVWGGGGGGIKIDNWIFTPNQPRRLHQGGVVVFVPNTLFSTFKQNICLGGRGGGGETEKERQKEKEERQTDRDRRDK